MKEQIEAFERSIEEARGHEVGDSESLQKATLVRGRRKKNIKSKQVQNRLDSLVEEADAFAKEKSKYTNAEWKKMQAAAKRKKNKAEKAAAAAAEAAGDAENSSVAGNEKEAKKSAKKSSMPTKRSNRRRGRVVEESSSDEEEEEFSSEGELEELSESD